MLARMMLSFRNAADLNFTARAFVTQNPDVKCRKVKQLERTICQLNSDIDDLSERLDVLRHTDREQDFRNLERQLTTQSGILYQQKQRKAEIERELTKQPASDCKPSFRPV